jgi:hypothetical protein
MLVHKTATMTLDACAGMFDNDLDSVAAKLDDRARDDRAQAAFISRSRGQVINFPSAEVVPDKVIYRAAYRNRTDDLRITSAFGRACD